VNGVKETATGYMGGHTDNPSYRDVCAGTCGHTEVVRVVYNAAVVDFDHLLQVFWTMHNPSYAARSQYCSIIFYTTEGQKEHATTSASKIASNYSNKIHTKILEAPTFYMAEEYHQQYMEKQANKYSWIK